MQQSQHQHPLEFASTKQPTGESQSRQVRHRTNAASSRCLEDASTSPELRKGEVGRQHSRPALPPADAHTNVRSPDHAHVVGAITNAQGDGPSPLLDHQRDLTHAAAHNYSSRFDCLLAVYNSVCSHRTRVLCTTSWQKHQHTSLRLPEHSTQPSRQSTYGISGCSALPSSLLGTSSACMLCCETIHRSWTAGRACQAVTHLSLLHRSHAAAHDRLALLAQCHQGRLVVWCQRTVQRATLNDNADVCVSWQGVHRHVERLHLPQLVQKALHTQTETRQQQQQCAGR